MKISDIKAMAPTGPHIEGLIRFSYEEGATGERTQLPEFELLSRVHEGTPKVGEIPRMKPHPLADQLISRVSEQSGNRLLSEVPIRFLGNKPESILSGQYRAFDSVSGVMLCAGNGDKATQMGGPGTGLQQVPCVGPDACSFANSSGVSCNFQCRMKVQVDGSTDPLACFEFQSSGVNTYRTLSAKLAMLHSLYGNLRGLPFRLTSWSKSSSLSLYKPFFCANIELRDGLTLGTTKDQTYNAFDGFDQQALEGLENAMTKMVQDCTFGLDGVESVVTTWTPASEIMGRYAASGAKASMKTFMENTVSAAVKRAREGAEATGANTVAEAATESILTSSDAPAPGNEKIALTPAPAIPAAAEDPQDLCL